jgi:hypothetical protein
MGSLIEELKRQEEAARAEADRLRARIEELAGDLARAEEQATRLVIAREEVARVLGEPAAAEPPDGRSATGQPRQGSPIGAVTVLPWQEGLMRRCCRGPIRISWRWRLTRGARCGRVSSPRRRG